MLELNRAPELLKSEAESESQPSSNALLREVQLLWSGVSSTPEHLQKSFSTEERSQTVQNALISAGITLALTCLKRSPSLSWTAGRVVVPALSVPLLADLNTRTSAIASAMADTWNSDRNWNRNVEIAKEGIGKFTADFLITAMASGVAEKVGRSYFGLHSPGVHKLPELNREGVLSNWKRHMDGETIAYRLLSPEGGGARQVDLFIPKNTNHPNEISKGAKSGANLLVAQDGLKIDFGKLKDLKPPEHGLVNLKADNSIDYVSAFTHPFRFRVAPGINLSAWHHEGGLIKPGGWMAPKPGFSDAHFVADVHKTLSGIFKPERSVLAGYSSGAILSNEVASRLGPAKIDAVVSVASTVVGKELPAHPGQFRLFVRDNGDPTLPQQGGAGGKAKILASMGHKTVLNSIPENQITYGLSPYAMHELVSKRHQTMPNTLMHSFALKDGTPVLSHIKTNTGTHTWYTKESIAEAPFTAHSTPRTGSSTWEHVDINLMLKEIVNGNLNRFKV